VAQRAAAQDIATHAATASAASARAARLQASLDAPPRGGVGANGRTTAAPLTDASFFPPSPLHAAASAVQVPDATGLLPLQPLRVRTRAGEVLR
jgi:hypothetical protein